MFGLKFFAVAAFLLVVTNAQAFDLDVSKRAMMAQFQRTTISELVVGDSSFVNILNLCSRDSKLFLFSEAENENASAHYIMLKVHRIPGNSFDAEVSPETIDSTENIEDFLLHIAGTQSCSRYLDIDTTRTVFEVKSINETSSLAEFLDTLQKAK